MQIKHISDIIYEFIYGKPQIKTTSDKNIKNKKIKKTFITDHELRKKYYNPSTKTVTIPSNSIISPLSIDWIEYENIKIIFKD